MGGFVDRQVGHGMKVSGRAVLAAGVAALTGGALAFTPSVLPGSMRTIEVLPPVAFTANSAAMPVTDDDVRAALELIGEVSAVPGGGKVTIRLGSDGGSDAVAAALPAANVAEPDRRTPAVARTAATPDDPEPDLAIEEAGEDPAALNAASDVIDGVYAVTRYWANYVSLELGPWLINWIPFGYLISDQIYIWYPDFVLPVVDSFVYDFLDPVVNNPLDLGVWIDGIGDIVNAAVTGVYNGIVSEIEYVLDFGWFPIPLPPLPDFPLPQSADATEAAVALAASEADEPATEATEDAEDSKAAEDADGVAEEPAGETTEPTETAETTEGADEVVEETAEEIVDEAEEPAEGQPADETEEPTDDSQEVVDEASGDETGETLEESIEDTEEPVDEVGGEAAAGDEAQSAESAQTEEPADSGTASDSGEAASDSDE